MQFKGYLKNEEITAESVLVIDKYGQAKGEMPTAEARKMAEEEDFDLVLVVPDANPPVCRVADYGKLVFDAEKKEKIRKKRQRVTEVKEIRVTPGTAENDLNTKARAAMKFIKEGNHVKVVCRFKGREATLPEEGEAVLLKIAKLTEPEGKVEKGIVKEGRNLAITIVPA